MTKQMAEQLKAYSVAAIHAHRASAASLAAALPVSQMTDGKYVHSEYAGVHGFYDELYGTRRRSTPKFFSKSSIPRHLIPIV